MLRQARHEEKWDLHPELVEGGCTLKGNFAKVLSSLYHFIICNAMKTRPTLLFAVFAISALLLLVSNTTNIAHAQDTTTKGASPLTLQQAIKLVVERHPQVLDASEGLLIADAKINQAKIAFLPVVSGTASYQYAAPVAAPTIPIKLPDGSSPTFAFQPNNNFNVGVSGAYTVFDFGRADAQVATAQAQRTTNEDNIALTKRNLAYSTVQAFYAVLFLKQSIRTQDAQIRDLNEALARTQKRVKEGTATEFDALTTQVRIASAESQKLDIQNSLTAQEILLRRLLGVEATAPLNVEGSVDADDAAVKSSPSNFEMLTRQAAEQRIELKTARDAAVIAQTLRDASYKLDLPSIGLSANLGFRNGIIGDGYGLNDMRFAYSAGAQVSAPIFTPRNKFQQEEAELTVQSNALKVRDAEQQISADVQTALAALAAASGKLATTETQITQAREAARRARTRHANGLVTNLELLDAELALSQAELMRLQAQYNHILSIYALKRAVGEVIW
jgi:outer membrane protein TolC